MRQLIIISLVLCLSSVVYAAPAASVDDLQIEPQEESFLLTWTAPQEDVFGNPMQIEGFNIYVAPLSFFDDASCILWAEVTDTCYYFSDPGGWFLNAFFKVTAIGDSPFPYNMTYVPTGTFVMGRDDVAEPEHEVTITHEYFLGTHETTNQEYLQALQWAYDSEYVIVTNNIVLAYGQELLNMGSAFCEISLIGNTFILDPVAGGIYGGQSSTNHPVKMVSWYGAVCYCDWRSGMEDLTPFYQGDWNQTAEHDPYLAEGYHLPTEAEWEHAACYNDDRMYPWGETTPDCDYANFDYYTHCVGWTAPVGSSLTGNSQLGFQDLSGNLWEWIGDWSSSYSPDAQTDPLGPDSGSYRVARGGSWMTEAYALRCENRSSGDPQIMHSNIGFRIARTVN